MADNKQYITQAQENGAVMISEDVISTIVATAISEVEGVIGTGTKSGAELSDLLGKRGKGIRITIGQENEVYVDCNVILAYGQSVVAVAKSVQDAVCGALESMTGVKVAAVNVNVCGISRQ